jgi:2-oxo-4-hydroxy-4-carboxy-5-ureidoimidazoline decarboxylase
VRLDVAALDVAAANDFVTAVAPLFEGAPGFLYRLAAARPFGSPDELFRRAREIAHEMPEPLQVDLVDAHPRLGATPGSMSALSYVEQSYDREGAATDDPGIDDSATDDAATAAGRERARIAAGLERLNSAYEARFGFRYCVFVARRPRSALLPEMAAALDRERESELHRALDAVVDIAIDRHSKQRSG